MYKHGTKYNNDMKHVINKIWLYCLRESTLLSLTMLKIKAQIPTKNIEWTNFIFSIDIVYS